MGFTPEKCPQCNKVVEWKHENHVVLSKKQNYEITHVQSLTSYLAFGDLDSKFSVGEDLFEDTFRCPSCGYLHTSKSNLDYAKEKFKMDYNKSIAEDNQKAYQKIEQIKEKSAKEKATNKELTIDEQAEELTKEFYANYKIWQIKACAIRRNYDNAYITGYKDTMENSKKGNQKREEAMEEWYQIETEYLQKIRVLGSVSTDKKREFYDNFHEMEGLLGMDLAYWMMDFSSFNPKALIEKEWFPEEAAKRERENKKNATNTKEQRTIVYSLIGAGFFIPFLGIILFAPYGEYAGSLISAFIGISILVVGLVLCIKWKVK